jgi:hypothetical protein
MIQTDINKILLWNKVQLDQLPVILKEQGFQFVKSFSTDEHRIFVSQDGQYKIIIHKNIGKVYSTKSNKHCLHTFAIVLPMPKLNDVKRA